MAALFPKVFVVNLAVHSHQDQDAFANLVRSEEKLLAYFHDVLMETVEHYAGLVFSLHYWH